MGRRICICGTQVPFSRGGAEILITTLAEELERRGFEVERVALPFSWTSRLQLLKSALAWRLLDLTTLTGEEIDLVIATRFPSYLIRHPNKVVWLIHQFRQAYDLLATGYSEFRGTPEDRRAVEMIRAMDRRTLSEARVLFTISQNTAQRLRRFNGLEAEALYPPPRLGPLLRCETFGDYILGVGRLDQMKRFDLLVRAMGQVTTGVRCVVAGTGPEAENLRELAASLGVGSRLDFLGWVEEGALADLYARCLAVYYAPYDEDYGYVTVEAFLAGKPVITTADSGGVLEFVEDGRNGFVCPPGSPRQVGARMDRLYQDRELAAALGRAGRERVQGIDWDQVVERLTATL